jgi:hypothetical protein
VDEQVDKRFYLGHGKEDTFFTEGNTIDAMQKLLYQDALKN